MNRFKKLFALILSAAMIISLSACGDKNGKTPTDETTTYSDGNYEDNGTPSDDDNDGEDESNSDDMGTDMGDDSSIVSDDNSGNKAGNSESNQKIYDAYADTIKETSESGYYLYDMDSNGVPELFVDEGKMFSVYTYKNGLQKVGEVVSYGSTLYINEDGAGLTLNRSLRESTILSHLTIKRGQIKQEDFLTAKAVDGEFDEDKAQTIKDSCKRSLRNGSGDSSGVDSDMTMLKNVILNGGSSNVG